jgi:uncharacterized protein
MANHVVSLLSAPGELPRTLPYTEVLMKFLQHPTLLVAFASVLSAQTPAKAPASPAATAPPASTASRPTAPDPKKVPAIEEIFRLTKPELMISNMLNSYKAAFSQAAGQGYEQEVRKFDDPAKYRADFTKLQDRVFALLASRIDWQKMKPQFVQAYSDAFTVDELNGMAAFYRSPAGKAFLEKTPQVFQRLNSVGQQQMASTGPEIQKMMNDFMNDIKKRSAAAGGAKPPAK